MHAEANVCSERLKKVTEGAKIRGKRDYAEMPAGIPPTAD